MAPFLRNSKTGYYTEDTKPSQSQLRLSQDILPPWGKGLQIRGTPKPGWPRDAQTLFVSAIIELIPNKTQVNPADNNKVRYAHNEQSNKLFTYFHNNDTLLCTFIPPRPPVILFPFAIFDTIFAATSVVKE